MRLCALSLVLVAACYASVDRGLSSSRLGKYYALIVPLQIIIEGAASAEITALEARASERSSVDASTFCSTSNESEFFLCVPKAALQTLACIHAMQGKRGHSSRKSITPSA